jgi:hypothetical protein
VARRNTHAASRRIFTYSHKTVGRAIAPAVSRRQPGFVASSGHVAFVVDKVVFSEYLGFPWQFSLHRLFDTRHHLSSGAGTIGPIVADVPSGRSLTQPQETKINYTSLLIHFNLTLCVIFNSTAFFNCMNILVW